MNSLNKLIYISIIALLIIPGCRQISDSSNELALIYPNLQVGRTIVVKSPAAKEIYNPDESILI
jgi:hypothetical protein